MNTKKAAGYDEITPAILKELSKKAIVLITYIYNACIRLEYVPDSFKKAVIIMVQKPGKPEEELSSYRPISLLSAISKLFEKLILKRLKSHIDLPTHQFGFRERHATVDQVHRVTAIMEKAFEEK